MARYLATANVKKQFNAALRAEQQLDDAGDPSNPDTLNPEHMKLYPLYLPSLSPGLYGIEAKQVINADGSQELRIFNYDGINTPVQPGAPDPPTLLQNFTVVAPRFQLDPKVINSYYPPDGHVDEGLILPHIVFNDPHVPWQRLAVGTRNFQSAPVRALPVPWIALVVFDPDELKLSTADGTMLGIPGFNAANLPGSGAYPMTVGDYFTKITSRVNYDAAYANDPTGWADLTSSNEPVNIIFPKIDDVKTIFDIPIKFLLTSHVREINTEGFPGAGEENGLFSICVSHRSGPTAPAAPETPSIPRMQTVHLVSIENMIGSRNALNDPILSGPSDRMGIVSLFSWSYLSLPPLPTNFLSTMKSLAKQKQMLKPPDPILNSIKPATVANNQDTQTAAATLFDRLSLGYSITRWRTSTGEETTAFTRGPLTPVKTMPTPTRAADWPGSSNTGKDFQIMDKDTGIMDVTYSSAWQLGKLMAISDTVFNSALLRLRSGVLQQAASHARMQINGLRSASSIINNAPKIFDTVRSKTHGSCIPIRNIIPVRDSTHIPLRDPNVSPAFRRSIEKAMISATALRDFDPVRPPFMPSVPINSDWQIVREWISDKLFLDGIPAHYLFTDPSHVSSSLSAFPVPDQVFLPREALRFFYIDDAWLDCFLDGALSVSNHFDPVDDTLRDMIKKMYNAYLDRPLQPLNVKPQVPRYGFVLRSAIIKAMPDIKITVKCRRMTDPDTSEIDESRAPLVRLTKMDDFTVFSLLDCLPEDVHHITLSQPPHQQRFIVPRDATRLKKIFVTGAPEGTWPDMESGQAPTQSQVDLWYDESTRCLDLIQMYQDLVAALPFTDAQGGSFPEGTPVDSSIFALELNDKSWQLDIEAPVQGIPSAVPSPVRQLWRGSSPAETANLRLPDPQRPSSKHSTISTTSLPAKRSAKPTALRVHPRSAEIALRPPPTYSSALSPFRGSPILTQSAFLKTSVKAAVEVNVSSQVTTQYIFSVHPSYRGPAPLPFKSVDPSATIYSAYDYLPTETTFLVDLIFSIHRNPSAAVHVGYHLSSIVVIIPIQTALPDTPAAPSATEPLLLISPPQTVPRPNMLHNRRLAPLLTLASNGSELHITLVPRSAKPGVPKSLSDASVLDASFVLRGCAIANIESAVPVQIVGEGEVERGVVELRILEGYLESSGMATEEVIAESIVNVLKRAGGDTDRDGNEV